jgi:hypothetical protein
VGRTQRLNTLRRFVQRQGLYESDLSREFLTPFMPFQQTEPGFQVPLVLGLGVIAKRVVTSKAGQKGVLDLISTPIPEPPDVEELFETLDATHPMGFCTRPGELDSLAEKASFPRAMNARGNDE